MVSNYMPSVVVEIAFSSGYTTPAASRTWTDVSDYVELHEGMSITVGRQDEMSTAGPNDLSLTLDNTDGRFTAGRAGSPYYPNVKLGRPIRVKVTPPSGSTVTRFVGFIDEWPVEWDGSDAYARATIRAHSRLARLGLSTKLRSALEETIRQCRPFAYWTLGDPAGSASAADSSGTANAALVSGSATGGTNPVTFGEATGPGRDGLTAAQFTPQSQELEAQLNVVAMGEVALRGTIRVTKASAPYTMPYLLWTTSASSITVSIDSAGVLAAQVASQTSSLTLSGINVCDGGTHDVVVTADSNACALYVDGIERDWDDTGIGLGSFLTGRLRVGGAGSDMVVSHVAAIDSVTTTEVESMWTAVDNAFEGDRTDERLVRILGWAGVASTEVDVETGSETMTYQQTSGQSVVDALRDVESTEGGVLFDGADGDVKFHNRSHRYQKTASATLNMASQHVGSDYSPKLDRSTLVNDATVDNPTTGETARSVDTTSSDEYGIATASAKSVADSYDPLQQKAAWLVASYAEPRNRVPSLTVDVLAHQGLTPSAQTLLGITVGDMITVEDQPVQAPFPGGDWLLGGGELGEVILGDAPSGHLFVEGYTETIGTESYEISFNLSPTYPTLNTFVIGDPVRGKLDSGNVIAY